MIDSQHIIRFFIKIFTIQSASADDGIWQGEYQQLASGSVSGNTYALTIKKGHDVKTRRMSMRRISDVTESKSTCYMVTYDDFLVIKIPPFPLPDFETYLQHIEAEKTISRQLSPSVISLSPGLSPILSKIPELEDLSGRDQGTSEEDYIRLLREKPRFQQYVKIDGQFVFFMELSKYAFFDQVIRAIHNEKERFSEEIRNNSYAFDDPLTFEGIYGSGSEEVFAGVNLLIQGFEQRLDEFLEQHSLLAQVAEYEKREWLFDQLAGRHPDIEQNDSVAKVADDIRQMLAMVLDDNETAVATYHTLVRSCVQKKIFSNHRVNMEVLIVKVMDVLYRIRDCAVAIRDLKPDNMLVAGEREHGEFMLSDPEKYDLGLIDLETAVSLNGPDGRPEIQPLLAGTPAYMTPLHLFENSVLAKVYKIGLRDIFYLQDWFATLGIIFCISTGRHLFEKTARLHPEIVRAKKRGIHRNEPEEDTLANVSRIFWKSAADEFKAKMCENQQKFRNMHLALPEHTVSMLQTAGQSAANHLRAAIERCAASQKLFPRQVQKLIDASADALRVQREKWEDAGYEKDVSETIREQIIELFQRLESMKCRLKELDTHCRMIPADISCEDLLTRMFVVISAPMQGCPLCSQG